MSKKIKRKADQPPQGEKEGTIVYADFHDETVINTT